VVGYDFKQRRFSDLHRAALRLPEEGFRYEGTPALNAAAVEVSLNSGRGRGVGRGSCSGQDRGQGMPVQGKAGQDRAGQAGQCRAGRRRAVPAMGQRWPGMRGQGGAYKDSKDAMDDD
jgi:hypothetical protein